MLTTEQKLLCAVSHLGVFVGIGIIAPLIILLISQDPFVKQQSKEALAFQLFLYIAGIISGVLCFIIIGIIPLIATIIIGLIFPIIATVKMVDGIDYSYPITGRFVRSHF
ncbi:DUF4870 domain-containing protein [Caldisalinibacter kiritimatiensis]|uniref:DUF4870 domain-containing protein n=1 Tax=Caldisalinibacter kiritimatiensis TaxID=1304284 RepID=R1CGF3_9FIRM|nr:DUF4870 domain-containing protein [Caldisalinibacter kiritimatiensis]EOD01390.1 hypothetical protein L21TH_0536 [Caldisalinibacter kiritimatiensis]